MGQIVKRKKKGRPSKADLAKRGSSPAAATESELRRSHRRRNVRYNIDYDDYLDEDFEEEDEEEERRREKKLKLILKLNQGQEAEPPSPPVSLPPSRGRGVVSSSAARGRRTAKEEVEEEEDDEDEEEEEEESERRKRKIKKRRINVSDGVDDDEEEEEEDRQVDDDEDDDGDGRVDVDAEMRGRNGESKGQDSVPGTPSDPPSAVPLPDKKILELILDKLQKKDTYGVYAEPVDPEELPDYHDVIEHPMDFATVRKKLANGSYSALEQFESDVFLICSNAMQYNAPDTVYHKQARSIQELAMKKFEKLRIDVERSEKDSKIEQKTKSNFLAKKQTRKPLYLTTQEPVGSDFSSGAILATSGDIPNTSIAIQANACGRPSHTDVLADGNPSVPDYNREKTEELSSGKGLLSKFGRRTTALDDNRRATYNISNQPVVRSDSIFTTFEAEIKQLVAVGLQAELSYARSLARFAATLGPVAWKVASRRIEQALPVGCKFGRGWVGEYEPLPTPVLTFETRAPKESALFTKLQHAADVHPRKDDATHRTIPVPATDVRKDVGTYRTPVPAKPHPLDVPVSEPKSSSFCPANGSTSEGRPSLFTPPAMPSVPPIRKDESSNAAAVAARAWMSIGAGAFKEANENSGTSKGKISADSLYNPARELHPQAPQVRGQFPLSAGMHFQPQPEKNNFPLHGFPPQHVRMMNEAQFQNRPMVFPQLVATDLSRFQVQPHWQGLSPRAQPRQKQDSLPPDLNIGFQSPGSPVKQSSGVLVDSQQPDLALQL
ncbi:hypothetical protein CXB51_010334 [Gossypium anomalum]|uniref:Bromo domain-containing protein n=1 Tax=Gossypium anomalum TaxID=47600 RepID=A0A8J5ZN58_9ROSI|nr:hypothetical protein CXB51_010334 [Gossypium anomalum]